MNYKTCTECGKKEEATSEFFRVQKNGKYGLTSKCRPCEKAVQKKYQAKYTSSDKGKKTFKAYTSSENYKNYQLGYRSTEYGKAIRSASVAVRRDKEKCYLTKEDKLKIAEIYAKRDALNEAVGYIAYHVDHIMPVSKGGKTHPDNLQILTAEENLKKGAKIWKTL